MVNKIKRGDPRCRPSTRTLSPPCPQYQSTAQILVPATKCLVPGDVARPKASALMFATTDHSHATPAVCMAELTPTFEAEHALNDDLASFRDLALLAEAIRAVGAQLLGLASNLHGHHFRNLVVAFTTRGHGAS
jgi:hypothetical protein